MSTNSLPKTTEQKINWLIRVGWAAKRLPMAANLHKLTIVSRIIRDLESLGYEFRPSLSYGVEAVFQFACSVQENESHN